MAKLTGTYLRRQSAFLSGDPLMGSSSGMAGPSATQIRERRRGAKEPMIFEFKGAVEAGAEAWLRAPYSGLIRSWTILADPSGSITIDIWSDIWANWPPTDADSITGTDEPAITTDTKAEGTDLSGWSTAVVSYGDVFLAHVDSVTDITDVWLMLEVQ